MGLSVTHRGEEIVSEAGTRLFISGEGPGTPSLVKTDTGWVMDLAFGDKLSHVTVALDPEGGVAALSQDQDSEESLAESGADADSTDDTDFGR